MKRKTLTERIEELERELAELKAAPKTEQHFHYHYPPAQIPQTNPYPWWRPQQPWWYTSPNTSTSSGAKAAQ